ncbi:Cysteine-rich receptor-like protein kinase 10, partial [Mucuna pruriens]
MSCSGYMAPEYAADGQFSVKSDVFSFGILVLEVICGRKNRGLYHADDSHNLVGYAWTIWKEGRVLELIDSKIIESCNESEVQRCFHISLLCVQQNPEDRPTMASVILMLGSEMGLVEPKEPGFVSRKVSVYADSRSNQKDTNSTNEVTISLLEPR